MQQFRRSLTAREGSGVPLFLDRVLLGWFQGRGLSLPALTDADRKAVAALYARALSGGSPLFRGGDRVRIGDITPDRETADLLRDRSRAIAVCRDYSDVAPTSGVFTAPYNGELTATKRVSAASVRYVA